MHNSINWDDLRYVLAVFRSGSVTKAARVLGVNHATVIRRVATFEETIGQELFEKTVRGYQPVAGAASILEAVRAVETSIEGVSRAVAVVNSPATGTVRVTSTDTFCLVVLPEIVAEVQAEENGLKIELVTANSRLDLARLDADVTVRPASALPDELIGDTPCRLGFGLYQAQGYDGPNWLTASGPLERTEAAGWVRDNVPNDRIVAISDSFVSLGALAAAGLGRVFLPCCLGDSDPTLERIHVPERFSVPIWVAAHRDMIDVPRIRIAISLITSGLQRRAATLSGGATD